MPSIHRESSLTTPPNFTFLKRSGLGIVGSTPCAPRDHWSWICSAFREIGNLRNFISEIQNGSIAICSLYGQSAKWTYSMTIIGCHLTGITLIVFSVLLVQTLKECLHLKRAILPLQCGDNWILMEIYVLYYRGEVICIKGEICPWRSELVYGCSVVYPLILWELQCLLLFLCMTRRMQVMLTSINCNFSLLGTYKLPDHII